MVHAKNSCNRWPAPVKTLITARSFVAMQHSGLADGLDSETSKKQGKQGTQARRRFHDEPGGPNKFSSPPCRRQPIHHLQQSGQLLHVDFAIHAGRGMTWDLAHVVECRCRGSFRMDASSGKFLMHKSFHLKKPPVPSPETR